MNRIKAFVKALDDGGLKAAIIHSQENMRYLTGYTGEGCLFVCGDEWDIITDFRYVEQAQRQAPECACLRTTLDEPEKKILAQVAAKYALEKIAVETDLLSHDAFIALQAALEGVELVSLKGIVQEMRIIKDEIEIESIREAAAVACRAFDVMLGKIKPGMTEKQIANMLDYEMLMQGSEGPAFSTISASGPNGSLPHAIPSDHVLCEGELLTLDFGAKINGYCSDMTRTVGIGKIGKELKDLYQAVLDAQLMALDAVKPGAVCNQIDAIARNFLDERYPGAFGHGLGHGVGLFIHEQPRLSTKDTTVLVPGHVVTVEPGVYIQGLGGCRIEDMAIITSDGYINPITAPKQLIEL